MLPTTDTTNCNDGAGDDTLGHDGAGDDTLGFLSMIGIGSTLNLNVGRQTDVANPEDSSSSRRCNSSKADGNVLANIEDASSSNHNNEVGQEVLLTGRVDVSGGGDPSNNRQFDPSSSAASSHPASNGIADAIHRQDRKKGWVSICKPNWGSIGIALFAGVAVACVLAIIHNKNVLIRDLQIENASLKKEQQYLLDISQLGLGSEQAQQGGGKKGKAGKDDPSMSPSLSNQPSSSPSSTCDAQIVQDCIQQQQQRIIQRDVLIALYDATNGANWFFNSGWLVTGSDECNWYGVTCNGSGTVTELALTSNKLDGTIPSDIGLLTELGKLDIDDSLLSYLLPFLRVLTLFLSDFYDPAEKLDFTSNSLVDPIPTEFGLLTKLSKCFKLLFCSLFVW